MRFLSFALFFLPIASVAQTIETVSVRKERSLVQTGPASFEVDRPPWVFRVAVSGPNLDGIPTPRFSAPANCGTASATLQASTLGWSYVGAYNSQPEMDAEFGSGGYTVTFPGGPVALNLTGDAFPNAPLVTANSGIWNGGELLVAPGQAVTLTTNVFSGYTQNAVRSIRLSIFGLDFIQETEALNLSEPNRDSVSLTFNTDVLQSFRSYYCQVEFNTFIEFRRGARTEVSVYTTRTMFKVSTSPQGAPRFSMQPVSQEVSNGSTVVFRAAATGGSSYSWRKNGAPISGGTGEILVIFGVSSADVGTYSVSAENASGAVLSTTANLILSTNSDVGRLSNLSILTDVTVGSPEFAIGVVVGGVGTVGTKPLLVRAAGPSLAPLGVSGTLPDPRLEMIARSGTTIASNDNWAGTSALAAAFAQVAAFPFINVSSKDAAIYNAATSAQAYTILVRGGGTTGQVLAELYDATPNDAFVTTTPRLVNVSVRKQILQGTTLTAGFYVGGRTARTVLVRAIGPGLRFFGVGDFMRDPQLALFRGETRIAENDNWGGDAQLAAAAARVAAFAITSATSRDAMLLITLAPGSYSAVVSDVDNVGGSALVEVYEIR